MQVSTQWTHSDVWSQLATTPECLFKIGDRQGEKKWWNGDWWAICNAMRGIDTWRRVIRHRGVSDGLDRARPLWRSHSAWTEMCSADVLIMRIHPWVAEESKALWLPVTLHNRRWMDNRQVRHGSFKAILILDSVDVDQAYGHTASC